MSIRLWLRRANTVAKNSARMSASARMMFESLRADIALGRLHPRERLVESDLVARFNSNRPAVREALNELAKIGLVQYVPNKGVSVAELTIDELKQIYDMRIELENLAAARIPLPLDATTVARLDEIQSRHSAAVADMKYRDIFLLDELFHDAINAHCGNRYLEEMINVMSSRGLPVRYSALMDKPFLEAVRDEHLAIIDAIRASDRDKLVKTMDAHNRRGLSWFLENMLRQSPAGTPLVVDLAS